MSRPNPLPRACMALLAMLLLAGCGQSSTGYSPGAGTIPPAASGGQSDPGWRVCQGGNPRGDYNCTLN